MHAQRRPLIFLLSALVATVLATAAAAQAAGPGGGDPGARDGPAGAPPGGPGHAGAPADAGNGGRSPFGWPWTGKSEQDEALDAVRGEKALPLDQIIAAARHVTQGEIVNAELETVDGTLLYKLKVLEETGDVREFYFQAQSGALARIQ